MLACIIILTALILGFLFLIYKKTVTNHEIYQDMRKEEKRGGGGGRLQQMKMMASVPASKPVEKQSLTQNEAAADDATSPGDDDGYL